MIQLFSITLTEKFNRLIEKNQKNKIYLLEFDKKPASSFPEKNIRLEDEQRQKFISNMKLQRYPIQTTDRLIYLSSRKFECLGLLAQGKTYKEIANILHLTARTVEAYVKAAKHELCCYSKRELIHLFQQSPFAQYHLSELQTNQE